MPFEIRPVEAAHISFITETFRAHSNNPVRKIVSDDDFVKNLHDITSAQLKNALQTKKEVFLRVHDTDTGRNAAWAHWILPQDTDDPSPFIPADVKLPTMQEQALQTEMRTKYRQTRKEVLAGRRCFLLHNIITDRAFARRGAASMLITWPFDEADRLGLPCSLGTKLDGFTVDLYKKHGFKVAGGYEVDMAKHGLDGGIVRFVQMIREPRGAGKLRAAILVVSDTASKDPSTDKAGPVLKETIEKEGGSDWEVGAVDIVPDDAALIRKKVRDWCDGSARGTGSLWNLIITTGGTGFATKDMTPEAIEPLLERKAPGLVHTMLSTSLQVTPFAAMARPVAGTRAKSLIITLPGSPKGAKENLQAVLKLLPHACQQASGANSRQLHAGGIKKLEKDAGILSTSLAISTSSSKEAGDHSQNSGHNHRHSHGHGHDHHHNHHGPGPAGPHTKPEDRPAPNDPSAGPSARHRESPYPKLSVPEAISKILTATPKPSIVSKNVNPDLVGSILAEDVTAPHPVPAFCASIVDGYAVVIPSGRKTNAKGVFPIAGVSHAQAGDIKPLEEGKIARITTGAPLPPNASAVVMVEDTILRTRTADGSEEAEVEILTDQVKDRENVREIGSDVAAGSVLMRKGDKISAVGGELGLLASVGRASVQVYRQPVIGVMSTGDEIVPHDREGDLRLGEVRDSNRISLMAAVRGWGYPVIDLGIAKDVAGDLETALRAAVQRRGADIVITTGGVSMGELDLLKPTIERALGGTIVFGRVAMKPGMPTTFATVPHKSVDGGAATALVFSLPGNPASGMVTASLFVRPCLDVMSGVPREAAGTPRARVILAAATPSDAKREEYQRAVVWQAASDGRLYGRTTGMQRSSRIGSFNRANGLLIISPGQGTVAEGTVIDAMLLGPLAILES